VGRGHAREDPLHPFFSQLTQFEGVVDVEPIKLIPTWRNGRGGQNYIAKRLDHFLISEDIMQACLRYKSKLCNIKIFDHMAVILYLEPNCRKVSVISPRTSPVIIMFMNCKSCFVGW